MTDYKELIKKREELREELANVNDEIDSLRKTIFLGKLEKASNLIKEVAESGVCMGEIENNAEYFLESIADFIDEYIRAIERS